ncbi:MAG: tRNA pseudouridine(13) synthase TruD [Gammaproteobacteria bacterium]|nr:tRNA pseudouridine(13) synthase TruD [Gammaproteobacteria bacterium]MDH4312773.1 tRNA pseudouridine(13) synthase TruD [Gammaproteobacteria bacterium]MDH5271985.1 tRNA pseudouridine(13) synthase TruD [Gammaproteobacteria bacterium]
MIDPAAVAAPGVAPRAHGPPPATGAIRREPEDFVVDEILGFEPEGAGNHGLLVVAKRGANTGWVAAQLARHAGVAVRDVGFSGHKDRHALTTQAYSLPLPAPFDVAQCLEWQGEGYAVRAAYRHGRKLRPGSHRANRFELRIRDLRGDRDPIEACLAAIREHGVPNYFGPQRFGREGSNLHRAIAWARGDVAPRERSQRSFALSAARSYLFNAVLASRVARGDWNRLLPGEVVMLDGRRSFFIAEPDDPALEARRVAMDVHPSGPLPGHGDSPATGVARAVEDGVIAPHAQLAALLAGERIDHERRSLRLPVREFDWAFRDDDTLELRFVLPRGTFATAVLHEVLADAWDAGEGGEE